MTMPALRFGMMLALLFTVAGSGCTSSHYRKSADKESYGILAQKEKSLFGKTNSFTINTKYSARDIKDIKSAEIVKERLTDSKEAIAIDDALRVAFEHSRTYQLRKEQLYLAALGLTRERYEFGPKFTAVTTATGTRESTGDRKGELNSQISMSQLLKTGGRITATLANDVLRFYTGTPRPSATTTMSIDLVQPLLRGAGAQIVAENLTQAEREVVYEIRSFTHFQRTFALDILSTYLRLLQQKDSVRNGFTNYNNLVRLRERAEAYGVDRMQAFQVDQARQDEFRAKSSYILTVERYQSSLDSFKTTLGLPQGVDLALKDSELEDLDKAGLFPINLTETAGYEIAVDSRLDLVNDIDRFEDAKRKVKVAGNQFKPDLNLFASASIDSLAPTDYARFNWNQYQASSGVELRLPLDRLRERNAYRTQLINFERAIRNLSLALDSMRNDVRTGLRSLEQTRQNYDIQKLANELANRRVESVKMSLEAGRTGVQIRDLLDAQSALLTARNSVTQVLIDYHLARLNLLVDIGRLDTDSERFWLKEQAVTGADGQPLQRVPTGQDNDGVVPPEKLFGND
jgi:outer membrane protein TolC